MWWKKYIKIVIIVIVIGLVGFGIYKLAGVIVDNTYSSRELVEEQSGESNKESTDVPEEKVEEDQTVIFYNEETLKEDKASYFQESSESSEGVTTTEKILSHIENSYNDKYKELNSKEFNGNNQNVLVLRYKEDVSFSESINSYDYISIIYGANIVDFLGDNFVVYKYNNSYIVYDWSDLNAFNSESKIGDENVLNISSALSLVESYNDTEILYTKGVSIN